MRHIILSALLGIATLPAFAQIKAVTDKGEEVILNNDGTWKYASITPSYDTRLDTPDIKKASTNTFLLKGNHVKYGIWLDPKKWSFKTVTDEDNSPIEYRLSLKHESGYCMIIPEAIELSLEVLESAALTNARSVAPDVKIVREETRRVNGNLVKNVELRGTVEGIKFVYFGYYYTGKIGTVQAVCYTSETLYPKYKADMEALLSGFVTEP